MSRLVENPKCNALCRACHYRDFHYADQLAKKNAWANQKLSRWKSVLTSIEPAPENERLAYRGKSWLRVREEDGVLSFGMFRAASVDGKWEQEFVDWDTCPIHHVAIQKMIQNLKRELLNSPLNPSLLGVWMGTPHLVLVMSADMLDEAKKVDWKKVLVPPFDRVWFHHVNQIGRKVFGHRDILLLEGKPTEGTHPIRAFRQIAQSLLVSARKSAIDALLAPGPEMILDLYSGTGELSQLIPKTVGWVGIEMSKEACEYAQSLRKSETMLHRAFPGGVEQRLRDPKLRALISEKYSLYLNPPRSGLSFEAEDEIRNLLREKAPQAIAYLSCSASSLGRDLKMFEEEGYEVSRLLPYDFFPQTEHFETLAVLTSREL